MADNSGELHVEVAIDLDTSAATSELANIVNQFEDQAIDLKVKVATEGTEGEIKELQAQINQLVADIGLLRESMKSTTTDMEARIREVARELDELRESFNNLTPGTAKTFQAEGITGQVEGLEKTVKTLQDQMSNLGKDNSGLHNMQQTAEHTAEAFQETNKAIGATQQTSSETSKAVVANEKENQAAIKATTNAYLERAKAAQGALDADYDTTGKKAASDQLRTTFKRVEELGGAQGQDSFYQLLGTQEGSAAAYAYLQAFQEAFNKDVAVSTIERYSIPNLQIGNASAFRNGGVTSPQQEAGQWATVFKTRLQEIRSLYEELSQYMQNHELTPHMTEFINEINQLQEITRTNLAGNWDQVGASNANDIRDLEHELEVLLELGNQLPETDLGTGQVAANAEQASSALQEEAQAAEQVNEKLAETPESTQQVAENAQEAASAMNTEAQAAQDLITAEQAHGEAAVTANQQAQSTAEGAAEGYKEVAAAATEAANAEKQVGSLAEETLNKDYTVNGKKEAGNNLRNASNRVKEIVKQTDQYGNIDGIFWANTEAGASAGYEVGQAYIQGIKNGIAEGKLDKYLDDEWNGVFMTTKDLDEEDVHNALQNPEKYFADSENALQQQINGYKTILEDYINIRNDILEQLCGQPLTDELQKDIQSVVNARADVRQAQSWVDLDTSEGTVDKNNLQYLSRAQNALREVAQALELDTAASVKYGDTVAESSSAAAEGFEKVAEAEEKVASADLQTGGTPLEGVAETAEGAAKSIDEAAESEEKLVNTDVSGEASALDNISESAKSAEQSIDGAKESLEELSKQPTETPTPEPPQQQDNNDYQKTKQDISEVVEAYNTLIRTEEEWQRLNAIQPADWTEAEADKLGKLKAQRDAANETIAKATDLTEKEVAAQTKYNKKLSELEATQKNQIEYERQRTEALEARRQAQDEADAAVESEAAAQIARLQDEVDKNWELAKAEEAALEAYKTLDSLEMKHQQNQQTLNQGGALNVAQNSIEVQYEKAKAVIDATTISTDKLTAAEERHKAVATEAAEVLARTNEQKAKKEELNQVSELTKAYQTLETAGAKWVDLMNKQAKGNTLNTTQRIELDDLSNSLKVAMAYTQEHAAATDQDTAAAERWEQVQQVLAKSLNDQADAINKSNGELKGYASSLEEAKKITEQLYAAGTNGDPLKWAKDGTAATGMAKFGNEVQKVQYNIVKCGDSLYEVRAAIKTSQEATSAWEKAVSAVANRMKTLGVYLASFVSVYRIFGAIKEGVSTVNELNTQLTEMRKVSDETTNSLKNYQAQTFAVAKEVGSTAATIQASTADYLRLGKSLNEAAELAKNTSILMSVSEFEDVNAATEAMISMTQAFKEMSSMEIIDELNKIGNNFSISTSDLAMGMQTAASTLTVAGNSFEQSLALMTAGNAVIQDYSKTATGLRTISLRIMGTKAAMEELEDMGEDVSDYEVTTTAKMAEIIEALTQVGGKKGVNILTDNGNLRSTYDILLDIAKVWDQIREEDERTGQNRQQALLEQLAGEILPECIEMCA